MENQQIAQTLLHHNPHHDLNEDDKKFNFRRKSGRAKQWESGLQGISIVLGEEVLTCLFNQHMFHSIARLILTGKG
jgi:hypothetical protein